jgi:hypothetical protein
MTILLTTKRESFAIIAAERLESRPDASPQTSARPKIVLHPRIPLALGITGSAWWVHAPGQQGRPILNFLDDIVAQIASADDLVVAGIAQRMLTTLLPGFEEMKRDVLVSIALFKDGNAGIGEQLVGTQPTFGCSCVRHRVGSASTCWARGTR